MHAVDSISLKKIQDKITQLMSYFHSKGLGKTKVCRKCQRNEKNMASHFAASHAGLVFCSGKFCSGTLCLGIFCSGILCPGIFVLVRCVLEYFVLGRSLKSSYWRNFSVSFLHERPRAWSLMLPKIKNVKRTKGSCF